MTASGHISSLMKPQVSLGRSGAPPARTGVASAASAIAERIVLVSTAFLPGSQSFIVTEFGNYIQTAFRAKSYRRATDHAFDRALQLPGENVAPE
ncbi:MAG: hypothetical protein AAF968_10970 [Pseudomonadota bacterium]